MIDFVIGIAFVVGYIFIAYILLRQVRRLTVEFSPLVRILNRSFAYALFCGIGIVGGGGDPGFSFPCPIIIAGVLDMIARVNIVNEVVLPLLFWWFVILIAMLIERRFSIFNS